MEDLTFAMLDGHQHLLTISPETVAAVGFSVRNAWSDKGAYRFVTALVMLDLLAAERPEWYAVMRHLCQLTMEEQELIS